MLFLFVCFVSLSQGTSQRVINLLNLDQNGLNVCSRQTTQTDSYYVTTATIVYTASTTSCGWFGWSRCATSRPKTVYRTVQRTRSVSVTIISCCSGWQKTFSWSTYCGKAICSQGCDSSHGTCIAPNTCRCDPGWTGSTCILDLDECASNNGGCDQVCTNTPGSYQCSCNPGYTKNGHRCEDINECLTIVPSPCSCGVSGEPCGAHCANRVPGYSCSCANGFQLRSGGTICDDINECLTANGGCQQICRNFPGKFSCGCYSGFRLITSNGTDCEDVNECLSSNGQCSHQCINTAGSYFCRCTSGFFLDSNGRTCSDHNECLSNHHGCQHKCNNFQGSFFCSCNAGYALKRDNKTCSDVNECSPVYVESLNKTIIPAGCDQICHNTAGNYTCSCNQGFRLLYDGKRCRDVNECKAGTHLCEHVCHNTPGSYGCSCLHGYKLKSDLRRCEGLPCEAITSPPNGRMTCSGLVTNETCSFTCDDGYEMQGSERRTCLNTSEWSGQQTFCNVKSCGRLIPPERGQVYLPCYTTFGSSCILGCIDGFIAFGNNLATCRVTNTSEVAWDIGNFTCEEIILCRPNPCRHGGTCSIINSRQFSCDCEHAGYKGSLCEIGVVSPPDFPKLISGNPSQILELQAKPDNSLTVHFNPTMNLTIQPKEVTIQHPASKAVFQVTGNKSGVGMVSYDLEGVNKYDFTTPDNSFVFIGRNISSQKSIYTRLGLLVGELPIGCQQEEINNYPECNIIIAFDSNTTLSSGIVIESGPVHIVTPDHKKIPLSLVGYNSSSPHPSPKEIMERVVRDMGDQKSSVHGCSDIQLTAGLIEFIQKDAFPKSFFRYFTNQLPLWLKITVTEESNLFDIHNTLASLAQTREAQNFHPICKFPISNQSVVVLYRPTLNFNIFIENEQLSLSSKGSCFVTHICETGVFLSLPQKASNKVSRMLVMQDLAGGGWELLVSAFGFTTPRRYSTNLVGVPDGHLAEDFSDFRYNLWLHGSANILLRNSSNQKFAVNIKMTGEAFAFADDLNAVFTRYFSWPITWVFNGSAEFNITLQALGQRFTLNFYVSKITAKAKFGGKTILPPDYFTDDCRVPQGFVFALERSSKPFSTTPLSNFVRPIGGVTHLQIYHSVTGGQVASAQDQKNNLRFLEWQTQEIKRILFDVKLSVPELQSYTERWESTVEEMLFNVIKARRLLSSGSDWLQVKVLVAKLDDGLDIMVRAFNLLEAQLQPYRNRTSIETVIHRLIRLKVDLPKAISLSFFKSPIHQNFVGLRFRLTAQVCHKRLCFPNMQLSIWSLQGNECGTNYNQSTQEDGLLVEGKALHTTSLGSFLEFPEGGTLEMFLNRDSEDVVTTFESLVNLLGLKRNATLRMTGNKLSFVFWGPMFGEFDARLNVKADFQNVVDWNSVVFTVEGTMNKSSRLYTLLEKMITNETSKAATEATRRLGSAQVAFNNAKRKADSVRDVLKSEQFVVEELKVKKERAAEGLRVARLKYHETKFRFNSTFYFLQNTRSLVCEIQDCNYTCLNGCITPDLCQDPLNISYLERYCNTVEKPITVKVVQQTIEKRRFSVQTYKTVYTGNCRSGVSFKTIKKYAETGAEIGKTIGSIVKGPIGGFVGTIIGAVAGGVIGLLSKKIFGCSNTYERVPAEPQIVEYKHKMFNVKAVEQIIKQVKCTGHKVKTKPGGYGPPYRCCKQYGCQTKVIDPQCIMNNEECLVSMTELKFALDAMNETLQSEFLSLRRSVDNVKKATFSYEKARVRHESAVTRLKQVEAYMKQQLSAVEITNASMLHVRQIVDFGLKISQAIHASDSKKIVNIGEMQFSLSTASQGTRKIVFQCNVSTNSGQKKPVNFLIDFDQVERSVSLASKNIITKLFAGKHLRRKRSTRQVSANSTNSLHSNFIDYPYACLFVNKTHLYLSYMFRSLGNLISSVRGLNVKLSSGLYDLERLSQSINVSSSIWNASRSVNDGSTYPNSSFVKEYLEMIQVFKDENTRLNNDSSQSWNDTLEAWRAFLEVFTSSKGFEECSGTQDCINYFFEGAKEFYEFEDSPRALEIKDAALQLKEVVKSLTTEALTLLEAEQVVYQAVSLLKKTRDNSVLCGTLPRVTSSSRGEVILFPGDSLSLNCSAEKEEGLKYAWRKNDELIGESVDGSFYVRGVTKDNEGAYVCIVSNNKGSTFSNVTIVKVQGKPNITQHPRPQRVLIGSQIPATFICNATAEPSPTFQWFFQPTNSSAIKINETKRTLYMANPQLHHEGYYYCEASNEHGAAASQKARLDVLNNTVGFPRLLVTFNLTTHCWLTSNSSNSSSQYLLPCDSESLTVLLSSQDKNLTNNLRHSLARSLNVSTESISELQYDFGNTSKSSVAFVIDIDNEHWKANNFTSYIEIVEAIAVAEADILGNLEQFNSDVFNKTFKVPWNNSTLLGDPGSILVVPLSPECPQGQSLSGNGYICANCPAGSYYNNENDTCVECPLGTYQPLQGKTECISCGKNLTTAFSGTLEESNCIADCPAGSHSSQNRTCILCPLGTYQPSRGQLTCISCGHNLTTASNGTVDKMQCIKNELPTSVIPTTGEQESTASPSASSPRILELKLFFTGKLLSLDMEKILALVKKEVSRFLSTNVVIEKKSEIFETENGAQVVLFLDAADVDKTRLQRLLSEGVEIEYHGRKMRFTGLMTTVSSTRTSDPAKDEGNLKEQEGADELPWKLPTFIAVPTLVVLIIGIVGVVIFCKRRKETKSKPSPTSATTCQFDNLAYVANEKPPDVQENAYDYSCADNIRRPTRGGGPGVAPKRKCAEGTCGPDGSEYLYPDCHVYEGDLQSQLYESIELQERPEEHVTNTAATEETYGPIYESVSLPAEGPSGILNEGYDC